MTLPLPPLTRESLYHRICDASHHTGGFDTLALELSNEFKAHRREAAEVAARHAIHDAMGDVSAYWGGDRGRLVDNCVSRAILAACPASPSPTNSAPNRASSGNAGYEGADATPSRPLGSTPSAGAIVVWLTGMAEHADFLSDSKRALVRDLARAITDGCPALRDAMSACPASPASPYVDGPDHAERNRMAAAYKPPGGSWTVNPAPLDPMKTMDGNLWAQEFVRLHGGDHGLMLSWFCAAIMTGYDEGARKYKPASPASPEVGS